MGSMREYVTNFARYMLDIQDMAKSDKVHQFIRNLKAMGQDRAELPKPSRPYCCYDYHIVVNRLHFRFHDYQDTEPKFK